MPAIAALSWLRMAADPRLVLGLEDGVGAHLGDLRGRRRERHPHDGGPVGAGAALVGGEITSELPLPKKSPAFTLSLCSVALAMLAARWATF